MLERIRNSIIVSKLARKPFNFGLSAILSVSVRLDPIDFWILLQKKLPMFSLRKKRVSLKVQLQMLNPKKKRVSLKVQLPMFSLRKKRVSLKVQLPIFSLRKKRVSLKVQLPMPSLRKKRVSLKVHKRNNKNKLGKTLRQ